MILPTFRSGGVSASPQAVALAGSALPLAGALVPLAVRLSELVASLAVRQSGAGLDGEVCSETLADVLAGRWRTQSGKWVPSGRVAVVRRGRPDIEVARAHASPDIAAMTGHRLVREFDARQDQGDSMGDQHSAALPACAYGSVAPAGRSAAPKPASRSLLHLLPEPIRKRSSHPEIIAPTSA